MEPAATQGLSCTGPAGTFSRRRGPCTAHWVRPTGPRCPRPPWCVHGAGHTLDVHMARLLPEQTGAASQLLGQTEWLRLQGTRNPGRDLRLRPAARPCQRRGATSLGPRGVGAGRAPLLPSSAPLCGSTSSFISSFISSSMITFPAGQTADVYRRPRCRATWPCPACGRLRRDCSPPRSTCGPRQPLATAKAANSSCPVLSTPSRPSSTCRGPGPSLRHHSPPVLVPEPDRPTWPGPHLRGLLE